MKLSQRVQRSMSCWFLSIIFISIVKGGNMLEARVNYTTAKRLCTNHGNLFFDSNFMTNNGILSFQDKLKDLRSQFPEGESAWINGHVEYSYLVSWEGCYELDKTKQVNRVSFRDENFKLYHCIKDCVNYFPSDPYLYVSVRSIDCVCLSLEDLKQKPFRIKNSNCHQYQPYNSNPLPNTNDSILSIFAVIKENTYIWDRKHLQLCVKATKRGKIFVLSTVLCGSKSKNGIVCQSTDKTYFDNQLSSWLQANNLCQEETGTPLASLSFLETKIQNLTTNTSYWANSFRVFEVVPESSRSDNVPTGCLAVTHVQDKLVWDPDDCSQPKRVLCSDGLYDHFSIERTTTFGQENKTDTAIPKQENDGASSIAIYVAIAAVILIVLITISCCIYRRQKQHSIYKQPLHSSSSGMEHIFTSGEHQQISEYAEIYTSEENDSSTVPSSKIHKKPSRRTCRKSVKQNSANENFKMKELNDTKIKNRPADEEEYDRIELKGVNGGRRALEVTYSVGGDARIYSHTLETDSQENYDTMKSTKSVRQTMDDTYNKVGCTIGNDDTNNQDTCMYDHKISGTFKSTTTVDTHLHLDGDED